MTMKKCRICHNEYDARDILPGGLCIHCDRQRRFAAFARSCGLTRYPDPSGERYVYTVDGACAGKKSECIDFMDELWNALVEAKGKGGDLLIGEE